MTDRRIIPLPGGRAVLAENGPLRLLIQAFRGPDAEVETAMRAGEYAFECLERVAGSLTVLRQPHGRIARPPEEPIAHAMLESVRAVGDPDLTPMAAVAGTLSDQVADWLLAQGMTRAIVDNGGDIAIRLKEGESVTVGLRPRIDSGEISRIIRLEGPGANFDQDSGIGGNHGCNPEAAQCRSADVNQGRGAGANQDGSADAVQGGTGVVDQALCRDAGENRTCARSESWGVNTSGMGGRSLTRGIASAVTAFAETSSLADAAATAVANACFHEDPAIRQVPANTLDPNTDLGYMPVTVSAAGVSGKTFDIALERALERAEELVDRGVIRGAIAHAGGKTVLTREFGNRVGEVSLYEEG